MAASAASGPTQPEAGGLIDLSMYRDPELLPPESSTTFHPRLKSLWLLALGRPDSELRRQALRAFTDARTKGMEGLDDLVPTVTDVLANDADAAVRAAAAGLLAALDDPAAGAALLEASEKPGAHAIALIADPALARWAHAPATEVWTRRVADAAAPLALRVSAAQSLAAVGASSAVEPLAAVAEDPAADAALRLAAAAALADVATDGLVPRAASLAEGDTTDRLAAARMLAGHTSREARLLLDTMLTAEGQDPAVVAEAARSLLAIDPAELAKRAEVLVKHPDPAARLMLAQALLQLPSDARQPHALAAMLDDVSVDVRATAREGILAAAAAGQDVKPVVTAALAGGGAATVEVEQGSVQLPAIGWRGLEQAAFILGKLDHEPAAPRLVELLRHDRPEVRVAAATALRQLAVPATLPDLLARAEELSVLPPAPEGLDPLVTGAIGAESTQLFMAFGEMKFAEADALARKYIPKGSGYQPMARGAAIYALGKFHEGTLDPALAAQLASRLSDINPMDPEMTEVRRFAAVALGRMKAQPQVGTLRQFYTEENGSPDIGGASRWAIMQITGEELPPLTPIVARETGYFLEPVD